MDISEIRRLNLIELLKTFKKQTDFAEKLDKPASYISQLKKGEANGKKINMGNDFARHIETVFNMPFGWMDTQHGDWEIKNGEISFLSSPAKSLNIKKLRESFLPKHHVVVGQQSQYPLIAIEYMDVVACCGHGYANEHYPEAFTQLFTVEFLQANGLPIDGVGLVLMHACGDSMGNTIPSGTLILVNKKESDFSQFVNNKIYVFNVNGEMMCKRAIKNIDGSILLKSDSVDKGTFPDWKVTAENAENIDIFGRVRYVFMQM